MNLYKITRELHTGTNSPKTESFIVAENYATVALEIHSIKKIELIQEDVKVING